MKKAFSALVLAIVLAASSALAAEVKYIFATPGVVWGGTSAAARAAAQKVSGAKEVTADMDAHTVTVVFDDAKAKSDDFVKALSDSGFSTTGVTKAP